jgi:hypothetical protein
MPNPIRPVNDTDRGLFSVPYDKELTREPQDLGPIPGAYSSAAHEAKVKFYRASPEQTKALYAIWSNDKNQLVVEAQLNCGKEATDVIFTVPHSVGFTMLAELSNSGFLKNHGNGTVSLTEAGRMALSKEIMSQPSTLIDKITRIAKTRVEEN